MAAREPSLVLAGSGATADRGRREYAFLHCLRMALQSDICYRNSWRPKGESLSRPLVCADQAWHHRPYPPTGAGDDPRVWATPNAIFLHYEAAAAFLIQGGTQIVVRTAANAEPESFDCFFWGRPLLYCFTSADSWFFTRALSNSTAGSVHLSGTRGGKIDNGRRHARARACVDCRRYCRH